MTFNFDFKNIQKAFLADIHVCRFRRCQILASEAYYSFHVRLIIHRIAKRAKAALTLFTGAATIDTRDSITIGAQMSRRL